MRFFLFCTVIALLFPGCSPLANRHDDIVLNCGSDFEGYEPIQVLDDNSSRLAGKNLEAFEIGPAGKQKVAVSSKGCISGRQNVILVRHVEKSIGFVGNVTGTSILLKEPNRPRLKVSCPSPISVNTNLSLQRFFERHFVEQDEAFEVNISISTDAISDLVVERKILLNGSSFESIEIPKIMPEGIFKVNLDVSDLVRRELEPVTCEVLLDRTPPLPQLNNESMVEHVRGPQILMEVDDRRTVEINTNEGDIFYCLHTSDVSSCEPSISYQKPISLASWSGEIELRFRALDAAGNQSPIMSQKLIVSNAYQESEVQSLANSSRATAGKSMSTMLDAIRAEEKRRLLPTSIQRDRYRLSTYWSLLKNYLAPQAPLLSIPYSTTRRSPLYNDISPDGKFVCFGDHVYGGPWQLFNTSDQSTTSLLVSGTSCNFSSDGKSFLVHNRTEQSAHLFDTASLVFRKLPNLPVDDVAGYHIDDQSNVYVSSLNQLFKWTLNNPDVWEKLYESEAEFSVSFSRNHIALAFEGKVSVFDKKTLVENAEISAKILNPFSLVNISADGRVLIFFDYSEKDKIIVWLWDEKQNIYTRSTDFEPHQRHKIHGIVLGDNGKDVLLEHGDGTVSQWKYEKEKFILINKEIGVQGDIVVNMSDTQKPRSRFLTKGRVGLISSRFVTIHRAQSEGTVLSANIRSFVADPTGTMILAHYTNGDVKLLQFDGESLSALATLTNIPGKSPWSRMALSASGSLIALVFDDEVRLWRWNGSNVEIVDHPANKIPTERIAISEDGKTMAISTSSPDEKAIRVWHGNNVQLEKYDYCLPQDSIFSRLPEKLVFSPSGNKLLISCSYGEAQVWDLLKDTLTSIGDNISVDSAIFHESERSLVFNNDSVMSDQSFALLTWTEQKGIETITLNSSQVEDVSGSRDFTLMGSISSEDLVLWSPIAEENITVWDDMVTPDYGEWSGSIDIISSNFRTFVLNGQYELVYWPLSAEQIYDSLCEQLKPQIHSMNLQNDICK